MKITTPKGRIIEFKQGTLMNQSEKKIYDHEFPEHPLTVARALTHLIIKEILFQPEIEELSPFKK